MRGNDFLPDDWKTPEINTLPLNYDQMIRTEGWKIGMRDNEEKETTSHARTHTHDDGSGIFTRELITPNGKQYFTNDLGEALLIQSEVRNRMMDDQRLLNTHLRY